MPTPTLASDDDDEDEQPDEPVTDDGGDNPAPDDPDITPDGEVEDDADDGEDEEEEIETEPVEMPEDSDDPEESDGSLLGGSTLGVPNKVLLGIGIAAILFVVLLRYWEVESTTDDYSNQQVEQEVEETQEEDRGVREAGGSPARFDPEQQQDAINNIFSR